ncbi:MAG: hypothetical protein KBD37_10030, partial [Burkholderiales bacterium]|nr:hypothetical protein [Burkholderiales bacterium]
MTNSQNIYLKLRLNKDFIWLKLDTELIKLYSQLKLVNIHATIIEKLATYKIGYDVFSELKKIFVKLELCGIDKVFSSRNKSLFECKFNLALESLFGNKVCLLTNSYECSQNLTQIYLLKEECIQLPKLAPLSGDINLKLIAPFVGNYCLSLNELLVKAYDKSYLKISFQVLGQIQIIYVNKSIVKHIAQTFGVKDRQHHALTLKKSSLDLASKAYNYYDEMSTNRAINYIEKFLSGLCEYKCRVIRWNYAKLTHEKDMCHFSFKNKYFRGHILCEDIVSELVFILKDRFKQGQDKNT